MQMCPGDKPGWERLTDFEFVDAFTCTFADSVGFAVTALFVYGGILIAIYSTTDDIRIPAVLIFLTGGLVLPQVAAPAIAIATMVVLATGAGVLTLLYYRYSR